jgi:hypothetical protein
LDIDSLLRAIDAIDQERDEIARVRLITRANGSHLEIEGSTHEGESTTNLGPISGGNF